MTAHWLKIAVAVGIFLWPLAAHAQPPNKVPRIGYLSAGSAASQAPRLEAFREGLRELGHVEGRNILIEYRFAEGKLDQVPALAAELVRLKVNIIITGGPIPTRAAKEATVTIPIVMAQDPDPVSNGFIVSLARPGGNITGLATLYPEISGKRLELLKEIVPGLSRVAVLGNSTEPGNAQALKETQLAARTLGVRLQYLDVLAPKDIEPAFRAASSGHADALLELPSVVFLSQRLQVLEFAVKSRLPAIFPQSEITEAGGLMSYGIGVADVFRRAAIYVDKILKGANPAELPVEQPTKFELVINLKTAKALGLKIPPSVLFKADQVIQ